MHRPIPVTAVRYGERRMALIDEQTVWFTPAIETLTSNDPLRRFVGMKCLVAREMQHGAGAEPYDDALADFYTRAALIPDEEFDRLAHLDETQLGRYFNVPPEQVSAKRYDRAFLRPDSSA